MASQGYAPLPTLVLQLPQTRVEKAYIQGASYIYRQETAAKDWVIQHDMNKFPSITVTDSANTVVQGEAEYLSSNAVALHFSAPFAGTAYLN